MTPPLQSFYLNPKHEGVVFTVPQQSNFTIENAVYFEPTMIEHEYNSDVQKEIVYLKNKLA